MNYGVSVKMDNGNGTTNIYYGVIKEIIQMSFNCPGRNVQEIYLFKCDWFKNESIFTDKFGLISLYPSEKLITKEPFILAGLASQIGRAHV